MFRALVGTQVLVLALAALAVALEDPPAPTPRPRLERPAVRISDLQLPDGSEITTFRATYRDGTEILFSLNLSASSSSSGVVTFYGTEGRELPISSIVTRLDDTPINGDARSRDGTGRFRLRFRLSGDGTHVLLIDARTVRDRRLRVEFPIRGR